MTSPHLLAKAIRDEERVVDRNSEADERDDVEGVDRYIGHARDQEHAGNAADDREDAHAERHKRRDDRPEDHEKEHEGERQRDGLRPVQVFLENVVESVIDREEPGRLDPQRVGPHQGAQLGVVIAGRGEVVLCRDVHGDRVPVLRDELRWVEGRAVERRDDRGHARVAPEGHESRVEGRAELGACRGQCVAREEERERGRTGARKLALDQSRSAT